MSTTGAAQPGASAVRTGQPFDEALSGSLHAEPVRLPEELQAA